MGRLEKEAQEARHKLQKERVTVYTSLPYQTFMVHAIKKPAVEAITTILSPDTSSVEKVKALLKLRKALGDFERNFPEPSSTIGDPGYCWHPNSHILISIRDEFFTHCRLDKSNDPCNRNGIIRVVINFLIVIYDYDPPYRMMIDWWAKKLDIKNWRYDIPFSTIPRKWAWWTE